MKQESDGFPVIAPTSLGVRQGIDIDTDENNNVMVNGKGMSVYSNWRLINVNRIPKRLRSIVPGAAGSNNTFCYRFGDGPFLQGEFAEGLTLEPDSDRHGNVAPAQVVPINQYDADIVRTRVDWQIDET